MGGERTFHSKVTWMCQCHVKALHRNLSSPAMRPAETKGRVRKGSERRRKNLEECSKEMGAGGCEQSQRPAPLPCLQFLLRTGQACGLHQEPQPGPGLTRHRRCTPHPCSVGSRSS